MVTKKKTKKTASSHKKHGFIFITIGLLLLVFISAALGYHFNTWQTHQTAQPNSSERLSRINGIYKSLSLGSEYQLVSSDIFGDKRVYDWDKSRSYSSTQAYVVGADVASTVTKLRSKIEAAGFAYFEEPYPGSDFTELHFKSKAAEYIRLHVSSKPRDDAIRNDAIMGSELSERALSLDHNTGPANVTIKVNLDDNNE